MGTRSDITTTTVAKMLRCAKCLFSILFTQKKAMMTFFIAWPRVEDSCQHTGCNSPSPYSLSESPSTTNEWLLQGAFSYRHPIQLLFSPILLLRPPAPASRTNIRGRRIDGVRGRKLSMTGYRIFLFLLSLTDCRRSSTAFQSIHHHYPLGA